MAVDFAEKPQHTRYYRTGTLQILTLKMKPLQDSSLLDNFTATNNKINPICHTELSVIARVNNSFPSNSEGPANP